MPPELEGLGSCDYQPAELPSLVTANASFGKLHTFIVDFFTLAVKKRAEAMQNLNVEADQNYAGRMIVDDVEHLNWEVGLEGTGWLVNIRRILEVVKRMCLYMNRNESVLLEAGNGRDRVPQLCALVQLCLDPFYRTLTGFSVLIEKEFLSFGNYDLLLLL